MSSASLSYVFRPSTLDGLIQAMQTAIDNQKTIAFKGSGCSYGDVFQNSENVVIDLTRMNRILEWNPETGIICCEPGVTIKQLWQFIIGDGWWPPVVSGTSLITLGGAISANIHGKNNCSTGPIGDHLVELKLLLPNFDQITCSRETDAELFHAIVGGFGLLGCVTEITLQMKRIFSGNLLVEEHSIPNLSIAFEKFEELTKSSDYVVGWLDAFNKGRGIIHSANYLSPDDEPHPEETLKLTSQNLPETVAGWISRSKLSSLMKPFVNQIGMRSINALKYRSGKRNNGKKYRQSLNSFNFLLDSAPNWKKSYYPASLIQYQPFVPYQHAEKVFEQLLNISKERGMVPLLAVLKKHRQDDFLLSHSVNGFSLALDYKVREKDREKASQMFRTFNDIVLNAEGKFYFAKDSVLTKGMPSQFLGQDTISRFNQIKNKVDPNHTLTNDLFKRVF